MATRSSVLFGLVLATAIGAVSYKLHGLTDKLVDSMLIAIVLGMVLRNTVGLPARFAPGVRYSVLAIMPLGIVLMGARLDFFDVIRTSATALVISVVCVCVALGMTTWLCRRLGVGSKLGLLIGVGTAICGGTAIAVVAPAIEADERDTAFAIATVTLFGMIAVFVLPLAGTGLGMTQVEFGVWTGTSVHATPQVVATGFSYGPQAGDIATIVKLVRVLLLAPVAIGIGIWYGRKKRNQQIAHVSKFAKITDLFPPFIAGFLLLALANTANLLPDFTLHLQESVFWDAQDLRVVLAKLVTAVSTFLLTISMAGVGLGVDLRGIARTGMGALLVGLLSSLLLAGFSLGLVWLAL